VDDAAVVGPDAAPLDVVVDGGAVGGGVLIGGTETVGTGVRPVGDGCGDDDGLPPAGCVGGADGVDGSVGVVVGDDVGVVTAPAAPTAAGATIMGAWLTGGSDEAPVEAG
jgi:hypothetical protein